MVPFLLMQPTQQHCPFRKCITKRVERSYKYSLSFTHGSLACRWRKNNYNLILRNVVNCRNVKKQNGFDKNGLSFFFSFSLCVKLVKLMTDGRATVLAMMQRIIYFLLHWCLELVVFCHAYVKRAEERNGGL